MTQPEKKLFAVFRMHDYTQIRETEIKDVQEAVKLAVNSYPIAVFQTFEKSSDGFFGGYSDMHYLTDKVMTASEVLSSYGEKIKKLGEQQTDDFSHQFGYKGLTFNQIKNAPADAVFVVLRYANQVKNVVQLKEGNKVYNLTGEPIWPVVADAPKINPAPAPKPKKTGGHFDI